MNYRDKYNLWLTFDENTKSELLSVTDEKEIEDRFYKDLAFGTGGLRGIMGAGSNRMNKYTVAKLHSVLPIISNQKTTAKSKLRSHTTAAIIRHFSQKRQQAFLRPAALRFICMKHSFRFRF